MKDKKWAQREVDRYLSYEGVNEAKNALVFAKGVINQLDEPETLSQELPVIPKFVADYIEECKRFDESGRKTLYTAMDSMPKEVSEWMTSDVEDFGKGQELFARAWLDGYEVKKEPLYYVTNGANELMLIKKDGVISTVLIPFEFSVDTEYLKLHQLTESEIKDYDGRYVQFMEPTEVAE